MSSAHLFYRFNHSDDTAGWGIFSFRRTDILSFLYIWLLAIPACPLSVEGGRGCKRESTQRSNHCAGGLGGEAGSRIEGSRNCLSNLTPGGFVMAIGRLYIKNKLAS